MNEHFDTIAVDEMFCTAWFGRFRDDGTLVYGGARHEPPFLRRANGSTVPLATGGLPLGVAPRLTLFDMHVRLEPGDQFIVYGDGLSELIERGLPTRDTLKLLRPAFEQNVTELGPRDDVLAVRIGYGTLATNLRRQLRLMRCRATDISAKNRAKPRSPRGLSRR